MGCQACVCLVSPPAHRADMLHRFQNEFQMRAWHDGQSSAALSVSGHLPVGSCLLFFDWPQPENTTLNADCFSDAAQQKRVPYLPWYLCIGVALTKLPSEDKSEMQAAEKELAKNHKHLMNMQHCAFAGQRQRTRNIHMSPSSCCTSAISVIQLYSCCF